MAMLNVAHVGLQTKWTELMYGNDADGIINLIPDPKKIRNSFA
jgi:hypothetical protein